MREIEAKPQRVTDNLVNMIAKLSKENAFYKSAFEELQERINELEDKNAKKK